MFRKRVAVVRRSHVRLHAVYVRKTAELRAGLAAMEQKDKCMEPACFICKNEQSGDWEVTNEAKVLCKVQDPVACIAVIGPYRSGKSYLLNRIAGQQRE